MSDTRKVEVGVDSANKGDWICWESDRLVRHGEVSVSGLAWCKTINGEIVNYSSILEVRSKAVDVVGIDLRQDNCTFSEQKGNGDE
jgi:hypothetical protein